MVDLFILPYFSDAVLAFFYFMVVDVFYTVHLFQSFFLKNIYSSKLQINLI